MNSPLNHLFLNHKQRDECQQGYLSIGNFDGVHLGHQRILSRLVSTSREAKAPSIVLTFEPHPVSILAPQFTPERLTTLEKKKELIRDLGVDHVLALPVNREFLELSPREFFEQVILDLFQAKGLVEGPNFFFGKDRKGNPELLDKMCREHGMSLEIVEPEQSGDQMISSTLIRNRIMDGEIDQASVLLGRYYSIEGVVTKGEQRGKGLGFPTANLDQIPVLLPSDGVYAGFTILDGNRYPVALNIGPNPTFQDENRKIEAHLLNFQGDLYHSTLEIYIVKKVRSIKTFSSADQLITQIQKDKSLVEEIIDHTET